MQSNRTIPLANKMNTALVQITETEFVELKISKSLLKIDLTVEQIQALVANRLKKIIKTVDKLKDNFKDNPDFLKKMSEYEDAVNTFKTIFEFILQESGLNKDVGSNQEILKLYDPNEEILRFISEADNEFKKFEYRYINLLVPQEEHEKIKKLKKLHDVIEDNLGGIKGLALSIQDEVKRQRSDEQQKKETEETKLKIVEDELKIPKSETNEDDIVLTLQETQILIEERLKNAVEAISNLQSDDALMKYLKISGEIQDLRIKIRDEFENNFKGMLESINDNTHDSNTNILKFLDDTKKNFDIDIIYLSSLVPFDQKGKLNSHLGNIHKSLNGILKLISPIYDKVAKQQKQVEEAEINNRLALRKREEEARQKKAAEQKERETREHVLKEVNAVKDMLIDNMGLAETASTKIDSMRKQTESLLTGSISSDAARKSGKTETYSYVEYTKLKSDLNAYKVHLEAERAKQLEKILISSIKAQMKKELKEISASADEKRDFRKRVRHLIDSIQQSSSFDDKLNAFCVVKDNLPDQKDFKNGILKDFNESQPDLMEKYKTILEIDAILNDPNEKENQNNPIKTKDQLVKMTNWYDNESNQKKLDSLEKRRGDNKLLYVLNAIRKLFGKPEIKSTIGVTGAKVSKSIHTHFKPSEKSSEKKLSLRQSEKKLTSPK